MTDRKPTRHSGVSRRDVIRGIGIAGGVALAGGLPSSIAGARVAAQGEATLTVWDNWTRDVDSKVIDTLDGEFEKAHAGVKVDRLAKSFDDLKATAKLSLSSSDGPDLAQINQGLSDMGAMVKAGVLHDLGPYAKKYGWLEKLSPGIVARNSFTADGATFGEGNLYGLPVTAEIVGVFYNREKLAGIGASVPKTFAELEAMLDKLKAAGEIPLAMGNLEGTAAIHAYSEIENLYVDQTYLDNFVYGRNNVSFATPENEKAAAKLKEWVDKDYFTPDFSGIGYDDSVQAFKDGQGALMLTGSWISGLLSADGGAEAFGFFLTPPETAGTPKLSVGGTSMAYAIRDDSEDADVAAAYADQMLSKRATELWMGAQLVPIQVDPAAVKQGTLYADLVTAWNHLNETNTVGHYIDWATPTFYDTITAALQELMAGQVKPDAFVKEVQADYGAYLSKKGGA